MVRARRWACLCAARKVATLSAHGSAVRSDHGTPAGRDFDAGHEAHAGSLASNAARLPMVAAMSTAVASVPVLSRKR